MRDTEVRTLHRIIFALTQEKFEFFQSHTGPVLGMKMRPDWRSANAISAGLLQARLLPDFCWPT